MKDKSNKKRCTFDVKMSIHLQILILCILCTIISVVTLTFTTLPAIDGILKKEKESHLNDFVLSHSQKIQTVFKTYEERINNVIAVYKRTIQQSKPEDMLSDDKSDAMNMLQQQLEYVKDCGSKMDFMVIYDKNGEIIVSSNKKNSGIEVIDKEQLAMLSLEEGIIKYDYSLGEDYWSIFITMTTAVYHEGEIIGYVQYHIDGTELNEVMGNYVLSGIEEPQFNLVDKNGIIIAHSLDSQIGEQIGIPIVLEELEDIKKGNYVEGVHYRSAPYGKDTAGFTFIYIPEVELLFGVGTLESVIYKSVESVRRIFRISFYLSLLVIAFLSFLMSRYFSRPIIKLRNMLQKLAQLEFVIDYDSKEYQRNMKRKDEFGDMYHAMTDMIEVVKEKLILVDEVSEKVNVAAAYLQSSTSNITKIADETNAITQQLSAGMEEMTTSTEVITSDIAALYDNISEMRSLVNEITENSKNVVKKAEEVRKYSSEDEEKTHEMFLNIKEKSAQAIEQSKAVNQINELAQAIMEIADQTSLLSLNASIEAARAGESGRGFAVVASEIGSLAQQSSDTVAKISQIVIEVNEAVSNIVSCLNTSQKFVESSVYESYNRTRKVMVQYAEDTQNTNQLMDIMKDNTEAIASTMKGINESIQEINETIQKSAIGVSDIAHRNSNVNNLISDSYNSVSDTKVASDELINSIKEFKL